MYTYSVTNGHTHAHTHTWMRAHTHTHNADTHQSMLTIAIPTNLQCFQHFLPKFLHFGKTFCCNGNTAVFPQSVYSGILLQVLEQDILSVLVVCTLNGCSNIW